MSRATEAPFGARLRRLREAAGLTQEELAERAGLTARGISDLERGARKRPYPHTVRSLADALELPEEDRASLLASVPERGATPPAPTSAASDNVLPTPPTPLLGRERELEEVTTLLGEVRLLTLTGTGGAGKTRLVIRAAREAAGRFADGVVFVALAPLGDASLVFPTVVRSMGLREADGQTPPREVLSAYLREKRLLLVLDNFEHVLEAAPEVAELIEACPNLTVLATSRAPLRVRGEQEYPVGPLALPASTKSPSEGEVLGSPSGLLFVERARAASPVFDLTEANASAVAAICWRLAGLPLALELAAAKARFLDPGILLSRLDRALSGGGARDLPERQRTMGATLDWSYELLSESEKGLFRRLSVFSGGFSLEAAEAVGADGGIEAWDVADLLGNLVEQSLVAAKQDTDGTRYGMLEPVRQYALERLEESAEEAGRIRERHAGHYLALGERVGLKLKGPEQPTWLGRLETELGNLRVAIGWSIEHAEIEPLARMAWAMWKFWWLRGHRYEGRRRMEEALATVPDPPSSARAKLLYVAATLGHGLGDFESTLPLIEESLALFTRLDDSVGISDALGTAGLIALGQARYEEGLALLEESVDINLGLGRKRAAGAMLGYAATALLVQGDLVRARGLAERALSLVRESEGARDVVYVALHPLAAVASAEGENERAVRLLEESLMLSAEIGDESNVAYCLEGLAQVAASENELARAARLWGAAEALLEGIEVLTYPHASDRSLYQRQVAAARARLDKRKWAHSWTEGRKMTTGQAVEYALGDGQA